MNNPMKTLGLKMVSLFFLMVGGIAVMGQQDRQEVPGDYFSLEGALELFKKSASPEEFERLLNSPTSKVNNLDLNGDGEIDYIRVIDRNEGNVHAFIIQAIVSSTESQDVAVIELEKLANGKAVLQITGDEDVYGIETIIEPTEEVRTYAGTTTSRVVVNVWAWPSVQYVYSPYYSVWVSPWHWYMRPIWWSSWRPISYYDYYSYWQPYRPYYAHCHTHRIVYAQQIYRPYRTSSTVYYNRHNTQIVKYRSNRGNHYGRDNRGDNGNHYGRDNRGNNGNHYGRDNRDDRGNNNGNNGDRGNKGNNNGNIGDRGNRGNHLGNDKFDRDGRTRSTDIKKSLTKNDARSNDRSNEFLRGSERKPNIDRSPSVKRDERTHGGRSESWSKPNVSERSSTGHSRNFERPTNKSQTVSHSSRGSQQRESRSGRSSGGGDEKRSGNRGNGKR
jgi:hypothetical protein